MNTQKFNAIGHRGFNSGIHRGFNAMVRPGVNYIVSGLRKYDLGSGVITTLPNYNFLINMSSITGWYKYDNTLFMHGTTFQGESAAHIYRFAGGVSYTHEWSRLGSYRVEGMLKGAIGDGPEYLYACGTLRYVSYSPPYGVVVMRRSPGGGWGEIGTALSPVGGYQPSVNCMVVDGGYLYVGGIFLEIGGVACNYVARWNGSQWSSVGDGLPGPYYPSAMAMNEQGYILAVYGPAGQFAYLWNGQTWSTKGLFGGSSCSLACLGNTFYWSGNSLRLVSGGTAYNMLKLVDGEWTPTAHQVAALGLYVHEDRLYGVASSGYLYVMDTDETWTRLGAGFSSGFFRGTCGYRQGPDDLVI